MNDANQDADETGSTAVDGSSLDETGDGEPTGEGRDFVVSRRDQGTPTSGAAPDPAADPVGAGTRRRFLAAVSAASIGALAGCSESSDGSETETGTRPPTSEPPETQAPTTVAPETATAEPAETATGTGTPTPQPVDAVVLPAAAQSELGLAGGGPEEITFSAPGGDDGGA